jgi:hypothetical protein
VCDRCRRERGAAVGPAKVIAWSAGAGALLAVAVVMVAAALLRTPSGAP